MKERLSPFRPHLGLAHSLWRQLLRQGDSAIDATCGNGKDSLALANLILKKEPARLICIDNQPLAIEYSKKFLLSNLDRKEWDRVEWLCQSHEILPGEGLFKLIVYNLGYLPGGDKSITTRAETTLKSVKNALSKLEPCGCISITCYPGHPEGKIEEEALIAFLKETFFQGLTITHYRWPRAKSPSLVWIQKTFGSSNFSDFLIQ